MRKAGVVFLLFLVRCLVAVGVEGGSALDADASQGKKKKKAQRPSMTCAIELGG